VTTGLNTIINKMSKYSRDRSRSEDHYRRRPNEPIPKLYAGNIDASIPEEEVKKELQNMCEKYGEISEIIVKSRAGSDHTYAFVQFKVYEDAEKAVQKYDSVKISLRGCTFKGKEIKIELGRGGRKELAPRNT